jgi:hypothetical protein
MRAGFLAELFGINRDQPVRSAEPACQELAPRILLAGSGGAPFPLLSALIGSYRPQSGPTTLIVGDSVMERVSRHDADRRTLGEMITERLGGDTLVLSRSALHPGLTEALLDVCEVLPTRPGRLLLAVNPRCFSPQWQFNPVWRLEPEIAAVRAWIKAPGSAPAPIDDVVDTQGLYDAFDNLTVNYPLSGHRTIGAFRRLAASQPATELERTARSREIFIFHYTHPLDPGNERLRQLRTCAERAAVLGIRSYLYVTPINHAAGARAIGPQFLESVRSNVAVLRDTLDSRCAFEDLSEEFGEADFFHEDLATEHLNERGRARLARRIVDVFGF